MQKIWEKRYGKVGKCDPSGDRGYRKKLTTLSFLGDINDPGHKIIVHSEAMTINQLQVWKMDADIIAAVKSERFCSCNASVLRFRP